MENYAAVDKAYADAVKAGAKRIMEPTTEFWGQRSPGDSGFVMLQTRKGISLDFRNPSAGFCDKSRFRVECRGRGKKETDFSKMKFLAIDFLYFSGQILTEKIGKCDGSDDSILGEGR